MKTRSKLSPILHMLSHSRSYPRATIAAVLTLGALTLNACGSGGETEQERLHNTSATAAANRVGGSAITVQDTTISTVTEVASTANAMQHATLSTKWMGTVTEVLAHEGDNVRDGQVLVRIDARELTAKASQIAASIADAEAMYAEASTNAARFKALYADSAATRAQYDASVTGLTRANAARNAARAAKAEMDAMSSYATLRAPFSGVITLRQADPGAFAAPGAPLITVQDVSTLRITGSADAATVRTLRRGQTLPATIDGEPVTATVEGIVPGQAGNVFTVNATVRNRVDAAGHYRYRAGSAATLHVPTGTKSAVLVPNSAIVTDGDLTGVVVRTANGDERRWVRLGVATPTHTEILSGLTAGEQIVVPTATPSPSQAPTDASPKGGV
jgi:RND family efflux transporter MFP subunit